MKDVGTAMRAMATGTSEVTPLRKRLEDLSSLTLDCCDGLGSIVGPEIKDERKEEAKPNSSNLIIAHCLVDLIFERVYEVQRQIQRINDRL
jgi:hypothetical protein